MASDSDLQKPLINMNLSNVTKLSSKNYLTRSNQIKALLGRYDLMEFIDESTTRPPATITIDGTTTPNPALTSWQAQDYLIHSALINATETPHQKELRLRKETEYALAIEQQRTEKLKLQLQRLQKEHDNMRLQAQSLESKYIDEMILRGKSEIAFEELKQVLETWKTEEVEMMERLLESYKEEQETLHLQAQALEQEHQEELRLRKEAEFTLAIEHERTEKLKLQFHIDNLESEHDNLRLKAEEFESKYNNELILKKNSEDALAIKLDRIKKLKLQLHNLEKNLTSQVRTWQDKYDEELSLRKETEAALSRKKEVLETAKGTISLLVANAMQEAWQEESVLKTIEDIKKKQLEKSQRSRSFICPITQEVMEDPHIAADGFTYEAEAIRKWLSTGHKTSPMTNLKLPHHTLIPNRALRSAIQDLV